jgi:serine/threonine-protein kinase
MPDTLSSYRSASSAPHLLQLPGAGEDLRGTSVRERYRFDRQIGAGGMSVVYDGEYLPIARRVALKVLHARADDDLRRRFRREFRLLATLEHPGVVRAFDIDETPDGRLFYAMERLRGRSLDREFDVGERVDPLRVVRIGIQVCAALHALHQRGVVHRDIKPGNVFLLAGSEDQIKLLDLGVARLTTGYYVAVDEQLRTPTSQREHTRTGVVMGTRGYEPPESGHVRAKLSHDIYSTGVKGLGLFSPR